MDAVELTGLLAFGLAGGIAGGLVGVGGGILYVPGLVIFADQSQLSAESTSLLAIVLVAAVGAMRQHAYENVRLREGLTLGLLSPIGVVLGAVVANAVPDRALQYAFVGLALFFAYRLARRALSEPPPTPAG